MNESRIDNCICVVRLLEGQLQEEENLRKKLEMESRKEIDELRKENEKLQKLINQVLYNCHREDLFYLQKDFCFVEFFVEQTIRSRVSELFVQQRNSHGNSKKTVMGTSVWGGKS